MLAALKSGSFLTRERARVYSALLLVAYVATFGFLFATSDGFVDRMGRPLGTDFANVYAAGQMVREGSAALAYDWPAHHAVQKRLSGRADIPYYGWHYPPAFLFVAAALAVLPYLAALLLYQGATLAAYLAVVSSIAGRREAWLPALAFPAVFINFGHGHNGFLTAGLLGGALLQLDRRPLVAGVLIGCLAYKPQFGLLIPLVLAATGRWRVFFAAAATVLVVAGLAWMAFGAEVWEAFRQSLALTQKVILEDGTTGFHKLQSIFAFVRLAGGSVGLAYAAQAAVSIFCALALVALWRCACAFELKAAGLLLAALLATPYALDYDLVVLAPAIAFLAAHGARTGFAPYTLSLLVALWALPFVTRPLAAVSGVGLGPVVMFAALVLVLHNAGVLHRTRLRAAPVLAMCTPRAPQQIRARATYTYAAVLHWARTRSASVLAWGRNLGRRLSRA